MMMSSHNLRAIEPYDLRVFEPFLPEITIGQVVEVTESMHVDVKAYECMYRPTTVQRGAFAIP